MAKKRSPEAPQARPELRISPAEAGAKLDERIAKAREYLAHARGIRSAAEIDGLKNEKPAAAVTAFKARCDPVREPAIESVLWTIIALHQSRLPLHLDKQTAGRKPRY